TRPPALTVPGRFPSAMQRYLKATDQGGSSSPSCDPRRTSVRPLENLAENLAEYAAKLHGHVYQASTELNNFEAIMKHLGLYASEDDFKRILNICNQRGNTLVWEAVRMLATGGSNNHGKALLALLLAGADPNLSGQENDLSPLMVAIAAVDRNERAAKKRSADEIAAAQEANASLEAAVEVLLRKGASVNVTYVTHNDAGCPHANIADHDTVGCGEVISIPLWQAVRHAPLADHFAKMFEAAQSQSSSPARDRAA
ncbi:MAG TPA: hypothetical protein VLG71_03510, partial [Candidatus Limnocylindria bacterium]|nr:hypothetical protein [Candidatus Limnocylindria bacterium]